MPEEIIWIGDEPFQLLFSESEIQSRVRQMALEIEKDYAGKSPIFVGVLNGAFIFMGDLIRQIQGVDLEIDFYKLSSYGKEKASAGQVQLLKSVDTKLAGRDVIVVEDIVDSGLSVSYIREAILAHSPKSLRFCALLFKESVADLDFIIDYVGFRIPKQFVIGYGLDYKQLKRNLPAIYQLVDSHPIQTGK
ncbi:hypoxanthine phosphoribosyltransferase [Chloroherpeton thalassium ATCC 35110]|uniref:Hypoxanthine phosphoribosyltransferase n=1 Tax=Chloroherpeton thalassium (strain ATCC 35110 / GB-78) TaxID=517418 RepID=B3QRX3_CHLT3|nr:hypoxanthine phosphoribosyltransferase [Chloroherpeton thalassium]ACF13926.1 hypoxanthine phosphoribosyltransferase [Chloroherpeton thalassium ATCC 35110]